MSCGMNTENLSGNSIIRQVNYSTAEPLNGKRCRIKKTWVSGAPCLTAPDLNISKYRLVFEHLAYAVCGIGDAAGNA